MRLLGGSSFKKALAGMLSLSLAAASVQPAAAAAAKTFQVPETVSAPAALPQIPTLPARAPVPQLTAGLAAPPVATPETAAQASPAAGLAQLGASLAVQRSQASPTAVKQRLDQAFSGLRRRAAAAVLGFSLLAAPAFSASRVKQPGQGWLSHAASRNSTFEDYSRPRVPAPPAQSRTEAMEIKAPAMLAAPTSAVSSQAPVPASDLDVKVSIDPKPHPLAEPIQVTVTISNRSSQVAVVSGRQLKEALQQAAGPGFDVSVEKEGDLAIAAGGSLPVAVELDVASLPEGLKAGGTVDVAVPASSLSVGDGSLTVPGFEVKLASVLDAKKKPSLETIAPWAKYMWDLLRLLYWGLGLGALYGAALATRRTGRRLRVWAKGQALARVPESDSLLQGPAAEQLRALEGDLAGGLEPATFYRRLVVSLNLFLSSRLEVRLAESRRSLIEKAGTLRLLASLYLGPSFAIRPKVKAADFNEALETLRTIVRGAEEGGRLGKPAIETLKTIGRHSEQVLYAESRVDPGTMREDLRSARTLLDSIRTPASAPAAPKLHGLLGLLPAIPPVVFQHPQWLLLLIPLAAYLVWHWTRKRAAQFQAPSADWIPRKKSWRQRLRWLPQAVLALALAADIGALADPTWGFHKGDRIVTSLDTELVVDRSGSMSERLPATGLSVSKIDAAKDAAKQLLDAQRGTTNRVGLIVFTDQPHMVMNLTLDYDALDSAFAQIDAGGGTDIGAALDAASAHFLEMNIVDADTSQFPQADHVRQTLKTQGLAAALDEAKSTPGFLDAVLAKDHNRVIIFLTDGADGGRTVDEAIKRAGDLGIKIFAISVPYGDPATLEHMAQGTGGQFFDVKDNASLQAAFAEIDRLEKAMVKVKSPPRPIHHDWEFAQEAWLLVILSLLLGAQPISLSALSGRRLSAFVLPLALLPGLLAPPDTAAFASIPAQGQTAEQKAKEKTLSERISPYHQIPEVRRGNEAYKAGRYGEALEHYELAAKDNPKMPELSLDIGMAQARAGDATAAKASLSRAMKLSLEQHRYDVLAAAELEQGNVAAEEGDLKAALGYYRDAQRVRSDGSDGARLSAVQEAARNNYEVLLRQVSQQGGDGGQGGQNGGGKPQQSKGNQGGKQGGKQGDKQGDQQGQDGDKKGLPGGKDGGKGGKSGKQSGQNGSQQGEQGGKQAGQNGQQGQQQGQGAMAGGPQGQPSGEKQGQPKKAQAGEGSGAQKAIDQLSEQSKRGGHRGARNQGKFWGAAALAAASAPGWLDKIGKWLAGQIPGLDAHSRISWLAPHYLIWTLAAVLILGVLSWLTARKHFAAAKKLAGQEHSGSLWSWRPARAWFRKTALTLAGLMLIGTGAANPVVSSKEQRFSFGGEDVAVLQDVSASVRYSEDGRYVAATDGLERFIKWLDTGSGSDRIAVIPFAGSAGEAVLSTDDKSAVFALYHMGQDGQYLEDGTDLAAGVNGAVKVFTSAKDIGPRKRVLIIVSDGGDDDQNSTEALERAAAAARKAGITIYTIGIGTHSGTRIIDPEAPKGKTRYVTDGSGAPIVTGLNESALRLLGDKTGGDYYSAEGGAAIDQVLGKIATREKGTQEEAVPVENGIARIFLLPGAALLFLGLMTGNGTGRKKKKAGAALNGLALGIPLSLGLGASSGMTPVLVCAAVVGLLLLVAGLFSLPWGRAKEAQKLADEGDRFARIQQASNRMYMEKLLRGEFLSPEPARSGADPDDSVPYTNESWRLVDHRASARSGQLYARRFEEEPEIPLMVLVDYSKSSEFGSSRISKRDVIADSAAAIALAAAKQDMPVGAILFTDRVEKVIPPRTGLNNAKTLARLLMDFKPAGVKTDLAQPLREATQRLTKRGVVAVVSDFNDEKSGWSTPLSAAARRHVIVPVVVEDSLERKPLSNLGLVDVQDAETGAKGLLDTRSRAVREHVWKEMSARRSRMETALRAAGAHPLYLSNEENYLNRLVGYFQSGGRTNETH